MLVGIDMLGFQDPGCQNRGIGRYIAAFLEALSRKDPGFRCILYFRKEYACSGVSVSAIRQSFPSKDIDSVGSVVRENPDEVDILLLTLPFGRHSVPRKPLNGLKMAALVYDLIPFLFPENYIPNVQVAASHYASLQALKQYDVLLTISKSAKADCERELNLEPDRVCYIGCSSRDGFFYPAANPEEHALDQQLLEDLHIKPPFVFTVGGSDWRKNNQGLIDAFRLLPAPLRASHQLVIAGQLDPAQINALQAQSAGIRLELPGRVSDEALRAFYRNCGVFAFPSYYEGFGLPLLEAMQCGAPVIAGANSSQLEVVGDAALCMASADQAGLAGHLETVLTNDKVAARLRRLALVQGGRFRWDDIVDRTSEVFRDFKVLNPVVFPAHGHRRSTCFSGPKTRVAFVAPLAPQHADMADAAGDLLAALGRNYQIDVFHDDWLLPRLSFAEVESKAENVRFYSRSLFERRARVLGYRSVLYLIANAPAYTYVYHLLMRYPGIVTLIDAHLADLHLEIALSGGAPVNFLEQELAYCHPEFQQSRLSPRSTWADERASLSRLFVDQGVHLNRRVLEQARVIVLQRHGSLHSQTVRGDRLVVIPPGTRPSGLATPSVRAGVRARFELPVDATLIGCFGRLEGGLATQVIDGFAEYAQRDGKAQLVFVGPENRAACVREKALALGMARRIRFLGQQPECDCRALAGAMDIGLCLNWPLSAGENLTGLLLLLGAGTPGIAVGGNTPSGFPPGIVQDVLGIEDLPARLAQALQKCRNTQSGRTQQGRHVFNYVRDEHSWDVAASRYADLIESTIACRAA